MILLDTNILIDLDLYEFDPANEYACSMLSRAELEFGAQQEAVNAHGSKRRARLAECDRWFEWLPFDRAASAGYGFVASHARTVTGARLRNKDALIAGQAYSLGYPVMTRNVDDFAPFVPLIGLVAPVLRTDT